MTGSNVARRAVPHAIDARLDLPHARKVSVKSFPVGSAHHSADTLGAIFHAIQDALMPEAPAILEHAVERARRRQLARHGRTVAPPRDVRAVRHREVRLVIPGHRRLARQHEARLRRLVTHSVREHLVCGDPRSHDRPWLEGHAGQEIAGLRGMDAHSDGRFVEQAVDHVDLQLQGVKWLKRSAQRHFGAVAARPPVIAVDAVAREQHGKPLRKSARSIGPDRRRDRQRLEPRQRHGDAASAEHGAPGDHVHLIARLKPSRYNY